MPRLVSDRPTSSHEKPGRGGRVLLVDQSEDARAVLRTILERRGVQICEASSVSMGLELLRQYRPDVVVLDADAEAADTHRLRTAYGSELASQRGEMVILGNMDRDDISPGEHVVRKPYHYGPLIQQIEELVSQHAVSR